MIPHRVYLKNFLCHAEQEFRFEEHPVWLLHGPNGVGKSAVFDAMVYALYGESRRSDSRKNAVADVIRHGESSMRVEFDFEVSGQRYQVWRTRARNGQTKQGVRLWASDRWSPIRDIDGQREIDEWVKRTLGLPYETFVSAVLLRQGAAEKLIDSDKDARRELFRSFIDLEPYIRLNERVVKARADHSAEARQLRARLNGIPTVTDDQIAEATAADQRAEQELIHVRARENASRDLLGHARTWDQNEGTRIRIQTELDAASERARHTVELEQQIQRLQELRILVPSLTLVGKLQNAIVVAQQRHREQMDSQGTASTRHENLLRSLAQARLDIETYRATVAEFDQRIVAGNTERTKLSEEIGRSEKAAILHEKLEGLRSKQFEPDLDVRAREAEKAVGDAQSAKDAISQMDALVKQRLAYRQAGADELTTTGSLTAAMEEYERIQKLVSEALAEVNTVTARRGELQQGVAVAKDHHESAIRRRDQFAIAATKPVCSVCLQPIDAAHATAEKENLDRAVIEAEGKLTRLNGEFGTATGVVTTTQNTHRNLVIECRAAEQRRDSLIGTSNDNRRRAADARKAFEEALHSLGEPFLQRVVAITNEGFPTADDLVGLRSVAKDLPERIRLRDGAVQEQRDREQTQRDIQTLQQSVAAIGAPADVTAARAALEQIETVLSQLNGNRAEAKVAQSTAESSAQEFTSQLLGSTVEMNRLAGDVARAEGDVTAARIRLNTAIMTVPESHRAIALTMTQDEVECLADQLEQLVDAKVEERFAALADDRTLHAERERRLAEVQALIARLPESARRPAADVECEVSDAQVATREAEQLQEQSRTNLRVLSGQQSQRRETERQLDGAERSHALHDRLTGLLGADGIELDLVRGEECRIIGRANDILVRLSTGELRLEPPDPESKRTFDLSVRRRGCPEPIAVGNLSGGQRFRTAVSLALAVCQGAGDAARRLESVIIDEGFGSLDRDGRTAMVAELRDGQSLAQMFKRIIVVSHQEDFAAAFPVGYRFWSENGQTRSEPFGPR